MVVVIDVELHFGLFINLLLYYFIAHIVSNLYAQQLKVTFALNFFN